MRHIRSLLVRHLMNVSAYSLGLMILSQVQLRAYRSGCTGRSTILREAKDPAQAYLNPRPSIASHEDITRLLEAYLKRFTAWSRGGLPSCEIGYEQL